MRASGRGVARRSFGHVSDGAFLAAEAGSDLDATSAGEGAVATGGRARGGGDEGVIPSAEDAVHRAGVGVAGAVYISVGGAWLAAELRAGKHASTGASASAASRGAGGEFTPAADLAVFGAGVGVARTERGGTRACLAAVLGDLLDILDALLGASAAGLGAFRPEAKGGDAVNGAFVFVAVLVGNIGTALLATPLRLAGDGAGAGLSAAAAGLGAHGPATPKRSGAIDGAGGGFAALHGGLDSSRASLAAELGGSSDGVGAGLLAAATGGGAARPAAVGEDAVNRTFELVAVTGVGEIRAHRNGGLAAGNNLAVADLGAAGARLVASTPGNPSGDLALDGADAGFANFGDGVLGAKHVLEGELVGRTRGAGDTTSTTGGDLGDFTRPGAETAAASLGAGGPLGEWGDDAVVDNDDGSTGSYGVGVLADSGEGA